MSLCDFFKNVHQKFYSDYDISFMEYFLELTAHEGEFIVHHEKLIEYGIMTSDRSSAVKTKLDALELIENEDYRLQDVLQPVPQGGYSTKKVYMLTPEAFKNCLMRAQRRPKQKVDPVVYCDYYLLRDVSQPVPQGRSADSAFGEGEYSTKNIYMLTPEAFKKCLIRAQRLKQKVS